MERWEPGRRARADRARNGSPTWWAPRPSCATSPSIPTSPRPTSRASGSSPAAAPTSTRRSSREAARAPRLRRQARLRLDRVPDHHHHRPRRSPGTPHRQRRAPDRRGRDPPRRRGRDSVVPVGREGEILARGPECFLGYPTPRSTPTPSRPTAGSAPATSGRLDAAGFLRISGRRKDIIIRKGENISAREIEDLLATAPRRARGRRGRPARSGRGEIACAVLRLRDGRRRPLARRRAPPGSPPAVSRVASCPSASSSSTTSRARRAARS